MTLSRGDDEKSLGMAIREAREAKEWTLRATARALGVTPPFLSDVEHDRRCPSDLAHWETILGLQEGALVALDPRRLKRGDMDDVLARLRRLERHVFGMTDETRKRLAREE